MTILQNIFYRNHSDYDVNTQNIAKLMSIYENILYFKLNVIQIIHSDFY